jgi:hypothetical protein
VNELTEITMAAGIQAAQGRRLIGRTQADARASTAIKTRKRERLATNFVFCRTVSERSRKQLRQKAIQNDSRHSLDQGPGERYIVADEGD